MKKLFRKLRRTKPGQDLKPVVSKPPCKVCEDFGNEKICIFYFRELTQSVEAGCYTCQMVHQALEAYKENWAGFEEDLLMITLWPSRLRPFSLRVSLRTDVVNPIVKLEIFTNSREDPNYPLVKARNWIPGDSGSEECLEQMKTWYYECLAGSTTTEHRRCFQVLESKLPDRVIEVRTKAGVEVLRLVESKDADGLFYTALSHCWGQDRSNTPLRTTRENIESHKKSLNWDSFSKTFQDAVKITRYLNGRYLWIDSLCIIQDDEDDWREQASQMSSIYTNAIITIVASRAAHGGMGCFSSRPTLKIGTVTHEGKPNNIYVRSQVDHELYSALRIPNLTDLKYNPLFERGWCFQERLLSTRIIQFGAAEMVWQCRKSFKCECTGPSPFTKGMSFTERYDSTMDSGIPRDRRLLWASVVRTYTATELTRESDVFPALSSLAKDCQLLGYGKYYAGLWEEDLLAWLAWYSITPGRRPRPYTAPTFSWASRFGRVEWEEYFQNEESTKFESLVEILHISTKTRDAYPLGEVLDGFLELRGSLISATLQEKYHYEDEELSYEIHIDSLGQTLDTISLDSREDIEKGIPRNISLAPLLTGSFGRKTKSPGKVSFTALLLESVTSEPSVFRRIGLLRIHKYLMYPFDEAWLNEQPREDIKII